MSKTIKIILAGLAGATFMTTAANAGGFSRGTADTDILYEDGEFVSRSGIGFVMPKQDVVVGGVNLGNTRENFVVPNFAVKLAMGENAACAGTMTTAFGGDSDYSGTPALRDPTSTIGTVSQSFVANELGLTCSYGFGVGPGKLHVIGGVFHQDLDFEQAFGAVMATGFAASQLLELEDSAFGWRAGLAYEIPEIALRAQVIYRSAVDVSATGTNTALLPGVVPGAVPGDVIFPFGTGDATFPQSVEAKFQTGVAEGWLVFGGVKWTDWSVFEVLTYNGTGTPATLNFFWRDGWTVNAGVAHRFNEQFAGSASLTWDRGVSTGHDINTTTWTAALGGSFTPNERVELRAGGSYTYIESGVQNFIAGAPGGPVSIPVAGVKSSPSGHAISFGGSIKIKF